MTGSREPLPQLIRPGLWYSLAFALLVVVGVLFLLPMPDVGNGDKLVHVLIYVALSAGICVLLQRQRQLWLLVPGLIAYGMLIEWLQGLTAYRSMETADMLANGIGVVIGTLVRLSELPATFRRIERRLFGRV